MYEATAAGLHADTESLHILTTSRAEFTAAARASSRTVGLRNGRNHSKKHCYAERPTSESLYRHLGILPEPFVHDKRLKFPLWVISVCRCYRTYATHGLVDLN